MELQQVGGRLEFDQERHEGGEQRNRSRTFSRTDARPLFFLKCPAVWRPRV